LAERFRRPPAERLYGGSNPSPGSIYVKRKYCSWLEAFPNLPRLGTIANYLPLENYLTVIDPALGH
jgi:hypothetical protein